MLRHTRKTEIHSVSVVDGKHSLVFSDEGMQLETQATGAVSGSGKAYMLGLWREWHTAPVPGIHEDHAYYEIALDGSKHFRRIADAQPNSPRPVLNALGTKAALVSFPTSPEPNVVLSLLGWANN
jgi:hypothetical protein